MATATNKQRLLNQLFTVLPKDAEAPEQPSLPVLEQFLYAVCREGTTREKADRAFRNLREKFFDWNEIRVSSVRELEEALIDLPDAEDRAQRIIHFLQEVFEATFAFDLESLHKKKGGLKEAARQLTRYQAASDYVAAWVIQQSLGGHAIPVDTPTLRTVRRLGLIDTDQEDPETLRASLEHLVPKSRGALFVELVSNLAHDVCWEESPNCPSCPLASECPTAQEGQGNGATVGAGRHPRPKPR